VHDKKWDDRRVAATLLFIISLLLLLISKHARASTDLKASFRRLPEIKSINLSVRCEKYISNPLDGNASIYIQQ